MSRYDALSSEIYSLYAQRKPGGGSTATTPDSERLITPTDDVLPNRQMNAEDPTTRGAFGASDVHDREQGKNNISSIADLDEGVWAEETLDLINEVEDPYDPYFSLRPDRGAPSGTLIRRGTAKELIGRYQSMEDEAKSFRTSTPTNETKSTRRRQMPRGSASPEKDKKRSPIRQSIRNLLSVFKTKKQVGSTREHSGDYLTVPGTAYDAKDASEPLPSNVLQSQSTRLNISTSNNNLAKCTTPISPRNTGSLLYLSHSTSNVYPVWVSCSATLHTSHMLVMTTSAQGHPSTEIIPFTKCIDVRSLSANELEENERSLLPTSSGTNDVKIFELIFEGRQSERFAAKSVPERAKWVSAVW